MKNDLNEEQLRQEVTLVLPLSAVLRLANDVPPMVAGVSMRLDTGDLPAVGTVSDGEIFAGVTIDPLGRPAALWLLPGEFEGSWQKAGEWARDQDGELPSRIDALVLFKNVKGEFKEQAYWTGEQGADDADWAWCQTFDWGYQYYNVKDRKLRARAVRRSPL